VTPLSISGSLGEEEEEEKINFCPLVDDTKVRFGPDTLILYHL